MLAIIMFAFVYLFAGHCVITYTALAHKIFDGSGMKSIFKYMVTVLTWPISMWIW